MSRAALYIVSKGKIGEMGSQWLGRDLRTLSKNPPKAYNPTSVVNARKYGFHATIKAPFRLRSGMDLDALAAATCKICARHQSLCLPLALDLSRPMAALRPRSPQAALRALEEDIVTGLDGFRAPLTQAEINRRKPHRLTASQRALLAAWGYPFVLHEFDFHLTLTDALPRADRPAAHAALQAHFGRDLEAPLIIDCLSICVEDDQGQFHWYGGVPLGTCV